jgi:very-short-patch-repair endonuclease
MRRQPTRAEALLWSRLRGRGLGGHRVRRQHALGGRCIADFYCPFLRLVIEVDGPIHDASVQEDAARDAWMIERGLRVVRFTNAEVLANVDDVMQRLLLLPAETSVTLKAPT